MSESSIDGAVTAAAPRAKKKYVPAVTPRLRIALVTVFALFALLLANSIYLAGVTLMEAVTGLTYQDYFYLLMFLLHVVLGFLLVVPFAIFAYFHLIATRKRRNRNAVRIGYGLLAVCITLLVSGLLLTRIVGVFELKQPLVRQLVYWAHVVTPLGAMWLYWLHRLAGPPIKWRVAGVYAGIVAVVVVGLLVVKAQDPQKWALAGSPKSKTYFEPSLARTRDGNFISADVLMGDEYCLDCHGDIYEDWTHSAHKLSSFNNPAYLTSVVELRDELMVRDGDVKASRWCAGCHDPVPFFSGQFDDPQFDVYRDPTASAGVTCTVCHSITHVNSNKGNADYTIEAPVHYPFAYSSNPLLQWVNQQLVKAKPSYHKKTFLKEPTHKSPEFCGTCHKVHLPKELNEYKEFLRGQNHYDSYWLSGVSGKGIRSFYYPPVAQTNCNECHMPYKPSSDFGVRVVDGRLQVHDHLFPSANTAIAWWTDQDDVIARHMKFMEGVMRVDLFGIKEGDDVSAPLIGPLRPEIPTLRPGQDYLLESVIRTLKLGHHFTQGTVDSNEIWMDVTVVEGAEYDADGRRIAGKVIGRSGGLNEFGKVDPWSHFVNVFMLDREGNRINRRNAHDIFVPLYNHQIPPGAGQVVHYRFAVPEEVRGPVTIEAKLRYRKFDQEYVDIIGDFHRERGLELKGLELDSTDPVANPLPIMTLAEDRVTFPVENGEPLDVRAANPERPIPQWQRWNDYGIGLLLESMKGAAQGELAQAEVAFREVEEAGVFHGPINLARVYEADGRLNDAVAALERAMQMESQEGFPTWTVLWLTGVVNRQQGFLDDAIENLRAAIEYRTERTLERKFDFRGDYVVQNELALTLFERSKRERGQMRVSQRRELLESAEATLGDVLELDSENVTAHYLLAQIYGQLASIEEDDATSKAFAEKVEHHQLAHARYKADENAGDVAIAAARAQYPAANEARETIVLYRLQRPGTYELPPEAARSTEVGTRGEDPLAATPDGDEPNGVPTGSDAIGEDDANDGEAVEGATTSRSSPAPVGRGGPLVAADPSSSTRSAE